MRSLFSPLPAEGTEHPEGSLTCSALENMAALVKGQGAEGREGFEISSQSDKEAELKSKCVGLLLLTVRKGKRSKVGNINTWIKFVHSSSTLDFFLRWASRFQSAHI